MATFQSRPKKNIGQMPKTLRLELTPRSARPFLAMAAIPYQAVGASLVGAIMSVTNVSIARLTEWRDRALANAATALKEHERDDRESGWLVGSRR